MTRVRLSAGVVFAVLAATGCGATGRTTTHSHHRPAGPAPVVITKPNVDTSALPSAELRALRVHRAIFSSPTRVAFMTTGTASCVWLPARLTILGASQIRFDMRVSGDVKACSSGAVGFPIAVTIDPHLVDTHHPLTVVLAYKVTLCCGQGTRHWRRKAVAPALGRT